MAYRLFKFNFLPLIARENYEFTKKDEFSASLLKSMWRLVNLKLHVRILLVKGIICLDKQILLFFKFSVEVRQMIRVCCGYV